MGLLNYSYKDIIKKIKKKGFVRYRQGKGSHEIWYNPKDLNIAHVVIPRHGSKSISSGVVKEIIKSLGMTNREFVDE